MTYRHVPREKAFTVQVQYQLRGERLPRSYDEWCEQNGCDHGHCPRGCEHPQPIIVDGILVCGRCAVKCNEIVAMVPCTPANC